MEPIDEMQKELGWRETELALLKVFFQSGGATARQHDVLARAAWSLLYAHYEGYAKFCLTLFFERAEKIQVNCSMLPAKTKEYALLRELKRIRNLPDLRLIEEMEGFATKLSQMKPKFPEVDTKSNLWPNVLEDLLSFADIKCNSIKKNRQLLNVLVRKRNGIAHGQAVSASYADYLIQENAVYEVMYELSYEIDARLKSSPFV